MLPESAAMNAELEPVDRSPGTGSAVTVNRRKSPFSSVTYVLRPLYEVSVPVPSVDLQVVGRCADFAQHAGAQVDAAALYVHRADAVGVEDRGIGLEEYVAAGRAHQADAHQAAVEVFLADFV
jgi:hypothetical protein